MRSADPQSLFYELCRMVLFEGPEFHDDFEEPHEHDDLVQRGELGIAWPVFSCLVLVPNFVDLRGLNLSKIGKRGRETEDKWDLVLSFCLIFHYQKCPKKRGMESR